MGVVSARVVVACDKFKGSLTSAEANAAVSRGLRVARPGLAVTEVAVADGGDGFVDAAVALGFERVSVTVSGPTGEPVVTSYAVNDGTAVVELADACGLVRLPGGEPAPLTASSRGLGEVIAAALGAGAREIVVGVGGSASNDGGTGVLSALGVRFLDASGESLPDGGGALGQLAAVDLTGLDRRLGDARIMLASDVANPLLGPDGAAAVYGPQKGATPAQVSSLDAGLAVLAGLVSEATGRDRSSDPGAGAAGGVGFAALAVLGAEMRPGIEVVLDLADFAGTVAGADLVVTGEGSLDEQSLHGKTPIGVASRATRAGVPVVAVCGRRALDDDVARAHGIDTIHALTDLEPDVEKCQRNAAALLTELATRVGRERFAQT